jgi:hypothetical protein
LAFDSAGRAHMAYRNATGGTVTIDYALCEQNCWLASNWEAVSLFEGEMEFVLRLDAQGSPRLGFYTNDLDGNNLDYKLGYAWCNTACIHGDNWFSSLLGLPERYGAGVDLAFNSQNRPSLAFYIEDIHQNPGLYGLAYGECTANCEAENPSWDFQMVETVEDLNARYPIDLLPGCTLSSWMEVGRYPSLVLDLAGSPQLIYYSMHMQSSFSPACHLKKDYVAMRVAIPGSKLEPIPTIPIGIYLPLVTR